MGCLVSHGVSIICLIFSGYVFSDIARNLEFDLDNGIMTNSIFIMLLLSFLGNLGILGVWIIFTFSKKKRSSVARKGNKIFISNLIVIICLSIGISYFYFDQKKGLISFQEYLGLFLNFYFVYVVGLFIYREFYKYINAGKIKRSFYKVTRYEGNEVAKLLKSLYLVYTYDNGIQILSNEKVSRNDSFSPIFVFYVKENILIKYERDDLILV